MPAALCTVRILRGFVDPTFPLKMRFPVPVVKVRFWAPSTVLLKVINPEPPLLDTLVAAVKFTGFAKEIAPLVVARVPERETPPPPLWVNDPVIEVLAPAARVKVPVFEMTTLPAVAVIRLPLIEMPDPVREMPPLALVFKLP